MILVTVGVNWNRGQKICLRLRYPSDIKQFLPMEQVVDTMLHELSHIVHDAHDQHFHALWQQLRDEHEQLTRKGYTGEGFLSKGHKLGGKRLPMDEARRRARAAAEKRRVLNAGSGTRLGGAAIPRGADIRRVIADAVQRRSTVTEGCASGTKDSQQLADQATRNGFRTQAEEDDANERAIMQAYIELLQEEEKEKWGASYVPPSREHPGGMSETRVVETGDAGFEVSKSREAETRAAGFDVNKHDDGTQTHASPSALRQTRHVTPERINIPDVDDERISISSSSSGMLTPDSVESAAARARESTPEIVQERGTSPAETEPHWACPTCTLHNPAMYLCCSVCGMERPPEVSRNMYPSSSSASQPPSRSTRIPDDGSFANMTTAGSSRSAAANDRRPGAPAIDQPLRGWWACHKCGQNMEDMWWTCDRCGVMKLGS
jgi:hypothetical protein